MHSLSALLFDANAFFTSCAVYSITQTANINENEPKLFVFTVCRKERNPYGYTHTHMHAQMFHIILFVELFSVCALLSHLVFFSRSAVFSLCYWQIASMQDTTFALHLVSYLIRSGFFFLRAALYSCSLLYCIVKMT